MTNEPQGFHFKTNKKLALDNNALHSAFGMDARIRDYADKAKISVEDVLKYCNIKTLYDSKVSKNQLQLLAHEVYNNHVIFTPIKPNVFFQNYSVEHVIFNEHQQMLIDELTRDLLSPQKVTLMKNGFLYTKTEWAFEGNHNQNHDHDARIFAESIFAGVNLFTFDRDFENKELIYHTVKEFEKKHPETKGISNFRILPDIQNQKSQDKYIFER